MNSVLSTTTAAIAATYILGFVSYAKPAIATTPKLDRTFRQSLVQSQTQSIDLTSVPPAALTACYDRAAEEFKINAGFVEAVEVNTDPNSNHVLLFRNTRSGVLATCVVDARTMRILSFTINSQSVSI